MLQLTVVAGDTYHSRCQAQAGCASLPLWRICEVAGNGISVEYDLEVNVRSIVAEGEAPASLDVASGALCGQVGTGRLSKSLRLQLGLWALVER